MGLSESGVAWQLLKGDFRYENLTLTYRILAQRMPNQISLNKPARGIQIAHKSVTLRVHSFVKKTQETPRRELNIAITRMRELKNVKPH
jgi:hypothetical protein